MIMQILFVTAALCDPASLTTGHPVFCEDHGLGTAIAAYRTPAECAKAQDAMSEIQGGNGNVWPRYRGFAWCESRSVPDPSPEDFRKFFAP